MAYDEDLVDRLREVLSAHAVVPGRLTEKRMFGGLAFLIGGHMAVAASRQGGLLLRCDPGQADTLLQTDGVERMVMGGRELAGWLHVPEAVIDTRARLRKWVGYGVACVEALPPK